MTPDAEEILHESLHGQESLRLTRRFKLSHLSFALPRRETSARLFSYGSVLWMTDGMTRRCAAG